MPIAGKSNRRGDRLNRQWANMTAAERAPYINQGEFERKARSSHRPTVRASHGVAKPTTLTSRDVTANTPAQKKKLIDDAIAAIKKQSVSQARPNGKSVKFAGADRIASPGRSNDSSTRGR